jgi:hypothetical protein
MSHPLDHPTSIDGCCFPGCLACRVDALEAAGKALYMAGRWDCVSVDAGHAARLWEALRDALGLPVGTATANGVAR